MYIGIDLGGTNIAAGIIDEVGNTIYQESVPTNIDRMPEEIIKDIIRLANQVIENCSMKKEKIKSIGIGIPGLVDPKTGNVIQCINLNWYNVPLGSMVGKALDTPVFIHNDATLACLGEHEVGIMKGHSSGILLTLGTGVGGGIILNEQIYDGSHGVASEIGHMVVGENDYNCSCGKNGCLETFASATALIQFTKKLLLEEEVQTSINEKIKGDLKLLDGRIIFEAAKEGDLVANKAVDRLAKYLSIGIVNLINILDPDIFVLGGGVSKAGTFLLEKVKLEVSKNIFFKSLPSGKIELAQLGNEAGIVGAALFGRNKLVE